jgi:hypothetical protein
VQLPALPMVSNRFPFVRRLSSTGVDTGRSFDIGLPPGIPSGRLGLFGYFALFFFRSSINIHSSDFVYISPRRMNAPNTALQGRS